MDGGQPSVTVRAALPGEEAWALALAIRVAGDQVPPARDAAPALLAINVERLFAFCRAREHRLLIAEEAGSAVGFLLLLVNFPHEVTGLPEGYVAYVAVEPEQRRRGAARALMAAAEAEARRCGMSQMGLVVTAGNVAATQLYDALNYTTERTVRCKDL
ncbi:GNAT family N-acetyltransferase [bacterium]|nr:MAG: GNAT family N-acetyltransferase [bacterium]